MNLGGQNQADCSLHRGRGLHAAERTLEWVREGDVSGRLLAPPVVGIGRCRRPERAASDAVSLVSKHGATEPAGCALALRRAGCALSRHSYRRDCQEVGYRKVAADAPIDWRARARSALFVSNSVMLGLATRLPGPGARWRCRLLECVSPRSGIARVPPSVS